MYTLVFRLPDDLVQDDKYISVCCRKTRSDEKKWILEVKEDLVDEYGADDVHDFELVCIIPREVEVSFESDLS